MVFLSRDLLAKELLESLAILSELLDTLMELVEGHLVLEEGPAEFGFIVDEADLSDGVGLSGCRKASVSLRNIGPGASNAPAEASSFLGTGSLDFLSSSRRLGEIVKKSTPARALISPVYKEYERCQI